MGIIRRTFLSLDDKTFNSLYKSMVHCHLDYVSYVWSPLKLKYIDAVENVRRRATRQLPSMSDLSYPDRLKRLKLPTLAYLRARGDMIQCYKIRHGIYDALLSPIFRFMGCIETVSYRRELEHIKIIFKQSKYKFTQTFLPIRVV